MLEESYGEENNSPFSSKLNMPNCLNIVLFSVPWLSFLCLSLYLLQFAWILLNIILNMRFDQQTIKISKHFLDIYKITMIKQKHFLLARLEFLQTFQLKQYWHSYKCNKSKISCLGDRKGRKNQLCLWSKMLLIAKIFKLTSC